MPRNVEVKARIESCEVLAHRIAAIADSGPIEIDQDDTFFHCPNGRMKLRTFPDDAGELIFYRRANREGPKESFYVLSRTTSPEMLRKVLSEAYGQAGRVQKHRTLFPVGRTRVHLDVVGGLGQFLELEVVIEEGESVDAGIEEAHRLMARLGVDHSQLVEGAYVDLLARQGSGWTSSASPSASQ